MTVEQSATEADIKIRTPRSAWIWMLGFGGIWLALATIQMVFGQSSFAWAGLVLAGSWIPPGLFVRALGVDLTQESAIVRGCRRRTVPWAQVQAVVRGSRDRRVELILESGDAVTLPVPTMMGGGAGRTVFERDFRCIGQWWLAHRGESWRPGTDKGNTLGHEVTANKVRSPSPGS